MAPCARISGWRLLSHEASNLIVDEAIFCLVRGYIALSEVLMNPRILAAFLPVAMLVAACSSTAATPTGSPDRAGTAPSAAVASPSVAPTPLRSVEFSASPSAAVRSGEIAVTMTDAMSFEPESMSIKAGEPITFTVKNAGVIVHEFFVGTEAEQADHAAEMAMSGMSHGHHNALSLEPGETGSLTMTFAEAGSLLVGCHEAGHYEAGMQGVITVLN